MPEGITFETQAQIDSFSINYPNCTEIEGGVNIYGGGDITNLNGLNVLTSIWGSLTVANIVLTSMTGMENVTSIGGSLSILTIYNLTSLTGLENLTSVGSSLLIYNNNSLTSLMGLENITSVGGYIEISFNDALTSLSGLGNITIHSLNIYLNPLLSQCEVESICEYLAAPYGTVTITDNATGCNSPEEVLDSCEANAGYIDEEYVKDNLILYPNPASQEVNISTDDGREVDEVSIYTLTGQQLMKARPVNGKVDISHFQSGMYIVEVVVENIRLRQKLIIE